MLTSHPYMIAVVYFTLFSASLLGYGTLILSLQSKVIKNATMDARTITLVSGIYGFLMIYMIGTIANFFIPLNMIFANIIVAIGILILILNRKRITDNMGGLKDYVCIAIAFIIIISTLSLWSATGANYDFNLYHMQAIKWFSTQQLPFGLANLHDRFGFNGSWHLIMSVIEQPLLMTGKLIFISLPILLFFFLSSFIIIISRLFEDFRRSDFFYILSVIGITSSFVYFGFQAEGVVLVVGFILLFFVFRIIENKELTFNDDIFFLILCAFFYITVKTTSVVFAAVSVIFTLCYYLFKREISSACRTFVVSIVSGICILVPMMIKSVVLTGCLIYPVPFLRIGSLKWTIPAEDVLSMKNIITGWARMPGENALSSLDSSDWIKPWVDRFFANGQIMFLVGVLIIAILLSIAVIFVIPKEKKNNEDATFYLTAIIPVCSIVFWLVNAPDIRFGLAGLCVLPTILFTIPCYRLIAHYFFRTSTNIKSKYKKEEVKAVIRNSNVTLIISICVIVVSLINSYIYVQQQQGFKTLNYIATLSSEDIQNMGNITLVETYTDDGEMIYTPSTGDQTYNMPLPAAPSVNPALKIKYNDKVAFRMFWIEE